jgi:hypothetical protein
MMDRESMGAGTEVLGCTTTNLISVLVGILCTNICIVN